MTPHLEYLKGVKIEIITNPDVKCSCGCNERAEMLFNKVPVPFDDAVIHYIQYKEKQRYENEKWRYERDYSLLGMLEVGRIK